MPLNFRGNTGLPLMWIKMMYLLLMAFSDHELVDFESHSVKFDLIFYLKLTNYHGKLEQQDFHSLGFPLNTVMLYSVFIMQESSSDKLKNEGKERKTAEEQGNRLRGDKATLVNVHANMYFSYRLLSL